MSQKIRVHILENTTQMMSSSDAEILKLWLDDWKAGKFDHVGTWKQTDHPVELARLAWLHSKTAAVEPWKRDFTFESFLEVEVRGIDPEFL